MSFVTFSRFLLLISDRLQEVCNVFSLSTLVVRHNLRNLRSCKSKIQSAQQGVIQHLNQHCAGWWNVSISDKTCLYLQRCEYFNHSLATNLVTGASCTWWTWSKSISRSHLQTEKKVQQIYCITGEIFPVFRFSWHGFKHTAQLKMETCRCNQETNIWLFKIYLFI